jgi:membrane protein DedA with SNARE-associated domain
MDVLPLIWRFFLVHAYAVVFLASLIDATALPFPGRVLLIAAGAYAASGALNVFAVIALGALGAAAGDHLWYLAGRFGGDRLLRLLRRVAFSSRRSYNKARAYYEKFSGTTIIIGRFVAAVRILTFPLAAQSGIAYPRFLFFDLVGAIVWTAVWVLLGYAVGDQWREVADSAGGAQALLVVLVVAALAGFILYRYFTRRRRRARAPSPSRRK